MEGPALLLEGDEGRARALVLLQRHGRTTIAFSSLGSGYRYAFFEDDAFVPFVDTGRAWVAAGGPVAPRASLGEIGDAFVREARRRGRRAVFFAAESVFAERAPSMATLLIGEQPVWDPRAWSETVRGARSLREQVRRARAKGVTVTRLTPPELVPGAASRTAVDALLGRWLETRAMAPMGFVVQVEPFVASSHRLYYGAWRRGALVGFLGMVPVFAREGWFFEHLLRDPAAPNGTVELLFDVAMRALESDRVPYATFGLAPLSGPVAPWLRRAGAWGRPLYDFVGLRTFKQKLRPSGWAPVYLAYPSGGSSWLAVCDALSAFSRGGILRFGLATVLRGPDFVVRVLALLLVPWTIAIASVDAARWFPVPWVRTAWAAFDVALTVGLFALVARWRAWLATALTAAITTDACITAAEAVAWNAPRVRSAVDAVGILVAVAAPAVAAIVMWNARARHARVALS